MTGTRRGERGRCTAYFFSVPVTLSAALSIVLSALSAALATALSGLPTALVGSDRAGRARSLYRLLLLGSRHLVGGLVHRLVGLVRGLGHRLVGLAHRPRGVRSGEESAVAVPLTSSRFPSPCRRPCPSSCRPCPRPCPPPCRSCPPPSWD